MSTNEVSYSIVSRDQELEQYILSILFKSDKLLPPDWLKPNHFGEPLHQRFYKIYQDLSNASRPTNVNTIRKEYKNQFNENRVSELMDIDERAYKIDYDFYEACEELKIEYTKRKLSYIFVYSKGSPNPLAYASDEVKKLIEDISSVGSESKEDAIKALLENTGAAVNAHRTGAKNPNAIYTGITNLDKFTGGMRMGDMVTIPARPAMGKSAFASCMALNISKQGIPVKIYNGEMTTSQSISRMACIEGEVDSLRVRRGTLNDDELQRFNTHAANMVNLPIEFEFTTQLQELLLSIKRWRMNHDRNQQAVVIVDYLQKIKNELRGRSRHNEVAQIASALKDLALKQNILMITLAQLSRAVETRGGDKRPILSDINESGQIEQDSDSVIALYRPEYYGFETDDEGNSTHGKAELIILKNRHGATGTAECQFISRYAKFLNLYEENDFYMYPTLAKKLVVPEAGNNNVPF